MGFYKKGLRSSKRVAGKNAEYTAANLGETINQMEFIFKTLMDVLKQYYEEYPGDAIVIKNIHIACKEGNIDLPATRRGMILKRIKMSYGVLPLPVEKQEDELKEEEEDVKSKFKKINKLKKHS